MFIEEEEAEELNSQEIQEVEDYLNKLKCFFLSYYKSRMDVLRLSLLTEDFREAAKLVKNISKGVSQKRSTP